MPLLRTTRSEVERYALSLEGMSRDRLPVPWTASPSMDDCAAFCSSALWGGKPGPILWVDNFKTAGDGSYAAGHDLAPWDVLIFDWEGNGVGNHVEFMVGDLGNGYVTTFGANGSDTRAAAHRTRPLRYVQGRFRPAWTTYAAIQPPPTTTPVGELMSSRIVTVKPARKNKPPAQYLVNPDTMQSMHLVTDLQVAYWVSVGVPRDATVRERSILANFQPVGRSE